MDWTLNDAIRIERKFKEHGRDTLDPDERACLELLYEVAERFAPHPEVIEGMKMWKALPAEEREKYRDWKVRQFYAMKPLIDELGEQDDDA